MIASLQCRENHMFHKGRFRAVIAAIAVLGALALLAGEVAAKPGGGGSRGLRTFSAPPATATAPKAAAPIERTMTQPQRPVTTAQGQTAPAQGGMLGRFGGFGGGMLAGFLGAGLLGMMFGGSLFGGLTGGGFASFLGLLLQVGLVVIVARLLWTWWQRRNASAYATAGGPSMRDAGDQLGQRSHAQSYGGGGGGSAPANDSVAIQEADFDTFERRLSEVQSAYSAEDLTKLRTLVTPEMLGYFAADLADNTSRGVVNEVSDVKLLQGDLSEAWREGAIEYATLAMRFSLVDIMRDRASGKVVEGSDKPQEFTELWTFLRGRDGDWILSAIQES
jgi:predicted lipid-binding transport protein (Tim44 family)